MKAHKNSVIPVKIKYILFSLNFFFSFFHVCVEILMWTFHISKLSMLLHLLEFGFIHFTWYCLNNTVLFHYIRHHLQLTFSLILSPNVHTIHFASIFTISLFVVCSFYFIIFFFFISFLFCAVLYIYSCLIVRLRLFRFSGTLSSRWILNA